MKGLLFNLFVLYKTSLMASSKGFLFCILVSHYLLEKKLTDPDSELGLSSSASTNVYLAVGSRVKTLVFLWVDTVTHCRSGDKFCAYS